MKSLLFALFLISGTVAVAQPQPEMMFEDESHDFGDIPQNVPATYEFEFENTGTGMLIISEAEASCGCTVPEWPKQPIGPGKKAVIKVEYNAEKAGPFAKTITIKSNDPNSPTELRIKGNVVSKE